MFKYKSCISIPDSLWDIVSINIDAIIKKSWQFLPAIVLVRLLYDFIVYSGTENISIKSHVRTLLRTFFIAFFLAFYKEFLMVVDSIVGSFSSLDTDYEKALKMMNKKNIEYIENTSLIKQAIRYPFLMLFKSANKLGNMVLFLTHQGSILFMDSLKSIILIVLSHFGPVAAVLSILPGMFSGTLSTWLRNYVNIFGWTITLSILQKLVFMIDKIKVNSYKLGDSAIILPTSIVLLIAIFLTPLWTSMFLGNSVSSGIMSGISWATSALTGSVKLAKLKKPKIGRRLSSK